MWPGVCSWGPCAGRLVGRAGQEVHLPGGQGPSSPILLQEGDFSHILPFPLALREAEAGPGWPPQGPCHGPPSGRRQKGQAGRWHPRPVGSAWSEGRVGQWLPRRVLKRGNAPQVTALLSWRLLLAQPCHGELTRSSFSIEEGSGTLRGGQTRRARQGLGLTLMTCHLGTAQQVILVSF